jgi:hypothetical protein
MPVRKYHLEIQIHWHEIVKTVKTQ